MNNCVKFALPVLGIFAVLAGCPMTAAQQAPAAAFESLVAAAQQAQQAGDFAAAASHYKQAVKLHAEIPELWANLGLMQHNAGDIGGAIMSFQHANRLNASLYVPNLFLGIDLVRTGKAIDAIPFLLKAEKTNSSDPQAALALGRAYIAAGKFTAAADTLEHAVTLDPKLGAAWFTLGIAHLEQVEEDARILSTEGKDSAFAGALYAESLQKQARFGEAATLYKSLLNSEAQPPCLRSELGFALLREHDPAGAAEAFAGERTTHPECGLALLGQARMAIERGDQSDAGPLLNQLWNRDRGFLEKNAAVLIEGLPPERVSALMEFLSQHNEIIPSDLSNALLTAMGYSDRNSASHIEAPQSGDVRAAEDLYRAGEFRSCSGRLEAKLPALSADRLHVLAACAFFTGDDQLTARAASALQAAQPKSLEALYWSIQADERLALRALARFQQLEPDSARSHLLLGDIYHQLDRHDDAQAEYQKALTIAPGDPAALLGLATAYLSNNNNDGAIETAKIALATAPDDPELNLILGEALLAKYDYAGAEASLRKALRVKPQMQPHVHALIGKIYAETGRSGEAIEELKLAASSDEDGSIQYLLARLYRKLGNTEAANAALARMKTIKDRRRERGFKRVEDPELSSLEFAPGAATP